MIAGLLTDPLVLLLILAHLLGDFVLQRDGTVAARRRGAWRPCALHACVHGLVAYVIAGLWTCWLLPLAVLATHGLIDLVKDRIRGCLITAETAPAIESRRGLLILSLDQTCHLVVVLLIVHWLLPAAGWTTGSAWPAMVGGAVTPTAILLIGLITTTCAGGVVVGMATQPYLMQLTSADAGAPHGSPARGFEKGGRMIGWLERSLAFLFVLSGSLAGVGFLVGAKSIFRFGEISNPQQRREAEYILIGTLMSFTWALFIASLTRYAIDRTG
ncbi:MAG: DUF3307 domain-containing protein [Phycisphaeraceae bacterium]|nr:DUF3307 domain-containing protein [Phycisphaeraceae bacterium]